MSDRPESPTSTMDGDATGPAAAEADATGGTRSFVMRHLWSVFALAFLAFVLLGSVPARIWRPGSLRPHVDSKSILRSWTVQLEHLPSVGFQWFLQAAFVASLLVLVVGVVVAFRLMLAADEAAESGPADHA